MTPRRTDLAVFLLIAVGLAWAIALPLWFGDGVASPLAQPLGAVMMFTPSLGVLAAWRVTRVSRAELAALTGLGLGPDRARTFGLIAAAWLLTPVFAIVSLALSSALGLLTLDLSGLSLYREAMRAVAGTGLDPHTAWIIQLVSGLTLGTLITMIPAFGEEWGWRGWLLPRLTDTLGLPRALLLSGVIWGLWHAPLTLLGYNYPRLGAWAAPVFVGFCVAYGLVIGWLRLRSGSVWPAVVAHAAFNATAGTFLMLGDAAAPPDPVVAGPFGVVGWALLAALGVGLLTFLPVRRPVPA
ncbi:CPBP family intramembrane glutamic endopeptidase [Nonomuraea sp. NPDC047897]|uniref:CPBP family intramembrane glutamic endopeptidase n=1 Tax=Nonomuraea sp. NPDC047897 TaxID=3364346 RepID=UPI003712538A